MTWNDDLGRRYNYNGGACDLLLNIIPTSRAKTT
jgi:hypothetical protein